MMKKYYVITVFTPILDVFAGFKLLIFIVVLVDVDEAVKS